MYKNLVKKFRQCANGVSCIKCPYWEGCAGTKEMLIEAADAIEELAAFKAQIMDGHFYCMRDGVLYEVKVNVPSGKTIKLPLLQEGNENA